MKKFAAFFLAATLILSPIGNIIFQDEITAEARGYKSGTRASVHLTVCNRTKQKRNKIPIKVTDKATAGKTAKKPGGMGGGLMKGLLVGGLAGLLFGSLFANMGMLGSIMGLIINVLAIVFIIYMVRKIFAIFKKKERKRNEDMNQWNNR